MTTININAKHFVLWLLLAAIALCLSSCSDDDELKDKSKVINMSISSDTGVMYNIFDERGISPMECMLVSEEGGNGEWNTMAFGTIQGFDYEKGYEYELRVKKTTLGNPPADGSLHTYELLTVLHKKKIKEPEPPIEVIVNTEEDIPFKEGCPTHIYDVMYPEITVDKDGNILAGNHRMSYEWTRVHLTYTLKYGDQFYNQLMYMTTGAYVISPLSEKIIKIHNKSYGGPLLKDVIPQEEFDSIKDQAKTGDSFSYRLVLINAQGLGLQTVSFNLKKM
ncbi:DUF4377 domain-containing protein [Proteiniphilum sp. X52]|uniref:DUF4377 domain-containing protein n=1 Tax=Proteiniphilum sp. X52 TaxID=2382159 RepID=UPI000F0A67F3|nr:DUF4377 domain-containing protein [Proteiniphilum sp. X52]RNC66209.1 DUF4377 domain-containing protein [Proteiniphilum sp. X52]